MPMIINNAPHPWIIPLNQRPNVELVATPAKIRLNPNKGVNFFYFTMARLKTPYIIILIIANSSIIIISYTEHKSTKHPTQQTSTK